jgi:hypothetical protein
MVIPLEVFGSGYGRRRGRNARSMYVLRIPLPPQLNTLWSESYFPTTNIGLILLDYCQHATHFDGDPPSVNGVELYC